MVGHRQQQEKKHYDKAKAAFEAADTKLRQLKSKEDAKAFDIEKERNVLQVHLPLLSSSSVVSRVEKLSVCGGACAVVCACRACSVA
jgi:hypothetical protein